MSDISAATAARAAAPENASGTAPGRQVRGRFGGMGLNVAIGIAAVVTVLGIVLYGIQLSGGLVQTGMRNLDSWGLYITSFMFFVGLSAGGLIISSAPKVFGVRGFGGISKIAVWTSICCIVVAAAFIIIDLGQPFRVWELIVYSNFTSPLMWDVVVISAYLILSIVYLWAQVRHEKGKGSDAGLRAISAIALVIAVLVHSVTAWIFALNQSREMWHTALMAPWFVSSALVCGVALVLVVVITLRRAGYLRIDQANVVKMMKLLGVFVCVDLYFFGCDLLTEGFPNGSGAEVVSMLTTGVLAPFFWVEVVGCAITAVIAFVPKLRTNPLMVAGALLAIVGVFCKRVQLLVGGFQLPNLEYPGVMTSMTVTNWTDGMTGAYAGMVYWPQPIEFGITVGAIGLGALILLLGLRYLPLRPAEQSR